MMTRHNAIWYFTVFFLFILVASMTAVIGAEIIVDPDSFTVNLTGGDTVQREITVTWTGSKKVLCTIETDIMPDGEGITVNYSKPSPFTLNPGVNHVTMTINVAEDIMPGTYVIVTNFSCEAQPPPRPYYPSPNSPPVADASAGEIYAGYIGEEITFDGSFSYDDGEIVSWHWKFGDGTNGTGETTNHSYSNPGTYPVMLTVTDDEGAEGTYETTAEIMMANRPPTKPIVNGTRTGSKNIGYTYTVFSTDPDNDTIRYIFDWGDNTSDSSGFLTTAFSVNHSWGAPGIYLIEIFATDNQSTSVAEFTVLIDVHYVGDIGYLIDNDSDGIYDLFYCNETGDTTIVGLDDGIYLIDSDDDGIWDYHYWGNNILTKYLDPREGVYREDGVTIILVLVAVIVIAIICFIYHLKKKKKKKKKKGKPIKKSKKKK